MNNNLIINSSYKKAIELAGVTATINNIETKILVKEANAEYGIDYKKIISSTSFNQGDYVLINGVQYLIVDTEEQMSQSIYNVGTFRETKELILLNYNNKKVQGIVDRNKINIISTEGITGAYDQYNFIIPALGNKVSLNHEIVWDGMIYEVISIDATKNDLFYVTGKQKETYNPHVYTISLFENTTTLVEGGTYQISGVICTDNGNVVTNPTLIYSSSDVNIATVSDGGLVTGIKAGTTCNISVTYNGVSAILSLTVNVKPSIPVVSYSATSSNGYSFKKLVGATLSYFKTIDGVADTTLDISFSLDSVGQQLLSSSAISLVKKTASTLYIRNLTVTTAKSFVLTVTDNATGAIVATQTLSTTV